MRILTRKGIAKKLHLITHFFRRNEAEICIFRKKLIPRNSLQSKIYQELRTKFLNWSFGHMWADTIFCDLRFEPTIQPVVFDLFRYVVLMVSLKIVIWSSIYSKSRVRH